MYASSVQTLQGSFVESFCIVLEHDIDEQYCYAPGEVMKGCVVVKLSDSIFIQALTLEMIGEGHVTLDRADVDCDVATANETYVNLKKVLLGPTTPNEAKHQGASTNLHRGAHELAFCWQLPDSLPSSFIGKYGSISYLLKAALLPENQFCRSATTTSEPFMVLRKTGAESHRLLPEQLVARKVIGPSLKCCIPLASFMGADQAVEVALYLQRTTFAPGESMTLRINVRNRSESAVTAIHAAISMKTKYHVRGAWSTAEQIICKASEHKQTPKRNETWLDLQLSIPRYIPESGLSGCSIIDVSYHVAFVAEVNHKPDSSKSLRMKYPITLGFITQQQLAELSELNRKASSIDAGDKKGSSIGAVGDKPTSYWDNIDVSPGDNTTQNSCLILSDVRVTCGPTSFPATNEEPLHRFNPLFDGDSSDNTSQHSSSRFRASASDSPVSAVFTAEHEAKAHDQSQRASTYL